MRLIDADELWNELGILYEQNKGKVNWNDALLEIKNAPTIEERKKGEWIPAFDGKFTGGAYWFSCSNCKRIVPEVRNGGWNFCPDCGSYNGG